MTYKVLGYRASFYWTETGGCHETVARVGSIDLATQVLLAAVRSGAWLCLSIVEQQP